MQSTGLVVASALALASTALLGAMAATTAAPRASRALNLTLERLREIRVVDRVPQDGFSFDEPGLHLSFALALPEGTRLVGVAQPREITATDSTGQDLTTIDPGFSGEPEYVEVEHALSFGEEEAPAGKVIVHLATSARGATTFSLDATVDVTHFSGTQELKHQVGPEWVTLDPALFDGQAVRVRFSNSEGMFGEAWGLEVSPAEAADRIDKIIINVEGDALEHNGSMSDHRTIVYFFEGDFQENEPVDVTFHVRTGVQTHPVEIALKDEPLP